jgi:hypothetical protein
MAANRTIYFQCPEIPSVRQRFSKFLHRLV